MPDATTLSTSSPSGSSKLPTKGTCPLTPIRDCSPRYLMTVANGIAVQTAGGATRDDLQQVADLALQTWPPAGRP